MRRCSAVTCASGTPVRRRSRVATRTSCRKPGSSVVRLWNVRAKSSAPTTSTIEMAIWATTSARRRLSRSRPSVRPGPVARIIAAGPVRVARSAGVRPKMTHVTTARPIVKASTRQSRCSATNTWFRSVAMKATSARLSHCASQTPAAAPSPASSRLSAISCRTMRGRDAPMARRIAISRPRALARASIRFARFAHAMSSTRPAIDRSSQSDVPYCLRRSDRPVAAGNAWSRNAR